MEFPNKKTNLVRERGNTNSLSNDNRSKWKAVCITINNWTEEDYQGLLAYAQQGERYIIGKEKGADGTPHLQAYIGFKQQQRFGSIKRAIPRAHLERANGNPACNYSYCSKEGDFVTAGHFNLKNNKCVCIFCPNWSNEWAALIKLVLD